MSLNVFDQPYDTVILRDISGDQYEFYIDSGNHVSVDNAPEDYEALTMLKALRATTRALETQIRYDKPIPVAGVQS